MVDFAAVCTAFGARRAGSDLVDAAGRDEVAGDGYETVIGLEVHAQLLTESKMYCGCSARYADAPPNTLVCLVCGGFPGALPVLNQAAIEAAILTGLALNCEIPAFCKLDRKNYFYPDLPKGYQISQYDLPLAVDGHLEFVSGGETRRAGITRVHVEEDTGRLVHRTDADGVEVSLVDLNRSGVPLMEIVGEPDLRSPEEARDYLIGAAPDPALHRRLDRQHGGGRLPLRRQRLGARASAARWAPRSKSRT